jgi:hypothetical protein
LVVLGEKGFGGRRSFVVVATNEFEVAVEGFDSLFFELDQMYLLFNLSSEFVRLMKLFGSNNKFLADLNLYKLSYD